MTEPDIPLVSRGAHAALRGYRKQFLYTLFRVLNANENEALFQLEHFEDLEILSGAAEPLEFVQVKDLGSNLTYSDLRSNSPDKCFFTRALKLIAFAPAAKVVLVSFGPIGPEILTAWSEPGSPQQRVVRGKLVADGFSGADCERLFSALSFRQIDAEQIANEVYAWLEESTLGGDPEHAFKVLHSWMYDASERGQRITYQQIVDTLDSVGQYLQERTTHHRTWYTTVRPLEQVEIEEHRRRRLAEQFYEGVGATYQHILAGVDVRREEHLRRIQEAFRSSNTVILKGASGQGKSSLAYRYLHDHLDPRAWSYEVLNLDNFQHAQDVVIALVGHLKVVKAKLYIYVDVRPGNVYWTELVRGLASNPDVFILVTIREEDFKRLNETNANLGLPEVVSLSFDEAEAGRIYERLVEAAPSPDFLSFGEAWARFGGGSALLEFVHLVTKHESLRDRLARQVTHLQDLVNSRELPGDAVRLLRRVVVASTNGARLHLNRAVTGLDLPEPRRIIDLFESEYQLVKRDEAGRFLEGLHPIRSKILAEILLDEAYHPWADYAAQCLPAVVEDDVETFLTESFLVRKAERDDLVHAVMLFTPRTWRGVGGVLRSLLWLGIDEYIESNKRLIEEIERRNLGVYMVMDTDFCGYGARMGINEVWDPDAFPQETRDFVADVRRRQTPKETVFAYAKPWLSKLNIKPDVPKLAADFLGMAEMAFWVSFFEVGNSIFADAGVESFEPVNDLPLGQLATTVYGLSFLQDGSVQAWLEAQRPGWLERFQKETKTVSIEDDGETVRVHFIVAHQASQGEGFGDHLARQASARLDTLQQILPTRTTYASQGYGHLLHKAMSAHDESIKNISGTKFLPPWSVQMNSVFSSRAKYPFRLESWRLYAEEMVQLRRDIVKCLRMLRRAFSYYFRSDQPVQLLGRYINIDTFIRVKRKTFETPSLARSAVDAIGLVSEGQAEGRIEKPPNPLRVAVKEQEPYRKAFREVIGSGLANFFWQSEPWLGSSQLLGKQSSLEKREEVVRAVAETLGGQTIVSHRLPTVNLADAVGALPALQLEFRKRFARYFGEGELSALETHERKQYLAVFALWYYYVFHPGITLRNPQEDALENVLRFQKTIPQVFSENAKSLSELGINLALLSTDALWDEKPALWLTCDVGDANDYPFILEHVIENLRRSAAELAGQDFGDYLLDKFYANVVVIPLLKGKALGPEVCSYNMLILSDGRVDETFAWLDYAFQPVPLTLWEKLNVPTWGLERLSVAKHMLQHLIELRLLTLHAESLAELPKEPPLNKEIYANYEDELRTSLETSAGSMMAAIREMLDYFNLLEASEVEERHDLLYSILNLTAGCEILGTLSEANNPTEEAQNLLESFTKAYNFWVNDVITRSLTL